MTSALLFVAFVAAAPTTRITTVTRVVGTGSAETDRTVREAAESGAHWFLDVDRLAPSEQSELAEMMRRCGTDNRCVIERMKSFAVDLGVYVVANFEVDPPLITTELLDTKRGAAVGRHVVDAAVAVDAAIAAAVERMLLDVGLRIGGRLMVDVAPPAARARLDGRPFEAGTHIAVDAGVHTLTIELDGYESVEAPVMIEARSERALAMTMTPTESIASKWWFWVAIGTAVAGAAVAVTLATSPEEASITCHPVGGGMCPP